MSAAVEQVPTTVAAATGVFVDVEANNSNPPGTAAAAAGGAISSTREQVVVVEDIESGSVPPPGHSSPAGTRISAHGDALAVMLGLVSVVCLTIVMGELLNGQIPNATSATVFFLCAISSVAVFRKQRVAAAARRVLEGEHSATMLSTSHHPVPPRTLDHEARRSLFNYFVFSQTATDRDQENNSIKDSSGRGGNKEEEEASVITTATTTSVGVAAAAPVADSKEPSFKKTGLPRGTSEDWTTAAACVVCFGEYAPGDRLCRLPCRHTYHAQCIDQWLDKANHPCCPMCKADLLALHHDSSGDALAAITNDTANDSTQNSSSSNNNNNETPQPAADLQENTVST